MALFAVLLPFVGALPTIVSSSKGGGISFFFCPVVILLLDHRV